MIQNTIGRTARILLPVWLLLLQVACKKKETEATVPVVTISSISKNMLNIGDTLIIKGSDFSTTPAANLVAVASVSFPVINASASELSVVVPAGAQSGMLTIAFKGGQATQFNQPIVIAGASQPVIASITPANVYEGDTIVVTGSNFATPYDQNSILFNGSYAGKIINASPTELRVVVPGLAYTGPVQVTSGGLSSLPYQYTISKVSPHEDGNICWMMPLYSIADPADYNFPGTMTGTIINKGIANTALPQSKVVFSADKPVWAPDYESWNHTPYYPDGNFSYPPVYPIDNFVVNDLQHNAYYLASNAYPFPATVKLMKLSDVTAPPVAVWNKTFDEPGEFTNYYPLPEEYSDYYFPIHYSPIQQLAMDGNTIYIKMGMSDDYYVGDVSQSSPALTLQKNVFGDSSAYNQQFGKDYIFYVSVGGIPDYGYAPTNVLGLRYMHRGSKVAETIPLPIDPGNTTAGIVCIMANPSHGNSLLIVTRSANVNGNTLNTIYKFNADTKVLSVLYDANNWPDASSGVFSASSRGAGNTGFIWLGSHIYYATTNVPGLYTALRRLNDDGITPKIYTVYGRMEALTNTRGFSFSLFIGK